MNIEKRDGYTIYTNDQKLFRGLHALPTTIRLEPISDKHWIIQIIVNTSKGPRIETMDLCSTAPIQVSFDSHEGVVLESGIVMDADPGL